MDIIEIASFDELYDKDHVNQIVQFISFWTNARLCQWLLFPQAFFHTILGSGRFKLWDLF